MGDKEQRSETWNRGWETKGEETGNRGWETRNRDVRQGTADGRQGTET
jgi:hypothetical protein